MRKQFWAGVVVALAVGSNGPLGTRPAAAQDSVSLAALQGQILQLQRQQQAQMRRLQAQLTKLQAESAARDTVLRETRARVADIAQAPAAPPFDPRAFAKNGSCGRKYTSPDPNAPSPTVCIGNTSITLGGFVDVTGFYRGRNETAGLTTSWAGIPFANSPNYHIGELRESSQYSRLSLLVQSSPHDMGTLTAYFEGDLNGSGVTSTTVQTNSYSPRVRQAFGAFDDTAWGVHLVAGQAYSLVTPNAVGLVARQEQLPLTIDSGYVPGFVYTRQPQIRLTKDFGGRYWVGVSLETPQTVWAFNGGGAGRSTAAVTTLPSGGVLNLANAGSGGLNTTVNYSIDSVPDIVVKAAADTGFGHYEVYGLGRVMNARTAFPGKGVNRSALAGGLGAAATVPVVPGLVDLTANVLAGQGIGRYGAGQLPDATIKADGGPAPLPEVEALLGVIGRPTPLLALFAYAGVESIGRKSFAAGGTGYGYGSRLFDNSGCGSELSSLCPGANANTHTLIDGTVGAWYRIAKGGFGTVATGLEYSYARRALYSGLGGAPTTDESLVELSLRYLPFE